MDRCDIELQVKVTCYISSKYLEESAFSNGLETWPTLHDVHSLTDKVIIQILGHFFAQFDQFL